MKSAVAFGTLALGVLLLVAGTLWSSVFTGSSTWTAEKSERAAEVKTRLNNIGPVVNSPKTPSMHRGPDPGTLKAEFDALMKENDQLNAEFESARDNPKKASKLLKWSGIGLAIVGLLGWYAVKQS